LPLDFVHVTYLVALLIIGFVLGYGIKAAWHHHTSRR